MSDLQQRAKEYAAFKYKLRLSDLVQMEMERIIAEAFKDGFQEAVKDMVSFAATRPERKIEQT